MEVIWTEKKCLLIVQAKGGKYAEFMEIMLRAMMQFKSRSTFPPFEPFLLDEIPALGGKLGVDKQFYSVKRT